MEFYLIWISVSPTPFKYSEIYECFRSEIGMRLWPNVLGTAERAIVAVSCGQFGTVRLKFQLSAYVQETVGGR